MTRRGLLASLHFDDERAAEQIELPLGFPFPPVRLRRPVDVDGVALFEVFELEGGSTVGAAARYDFVGTVPRPRSVDGQGGIASAPAAEPPLEGTEPWLSTVDP